MSDTLNKQLIKLDQQYQKKIAELEKDFAKKQTTEKQKLEKQISQLQTKLSQISKQKPTEETETNLTDSSKTAKIKAPATSQIKQAEQYITQHLVS